MILALHANAALNGDRAKARLTLRATQEGSFEALLNLDVSMIESAKDILDAIVDHPDRMTAAHQLVDLLLKGGKLVGGTVFGIVGVIGTLRMLRGGKPEKIEERGDGTSSVTINHTTIIVPDKALTLLKDVPTREALEQFSEKALNLDGIESVRLAGEDTEPVHLDRRDREALTLPEPEEPEEPPERTERIMRLQLITPQFAEGYKLRFTDGNSRFTATMEDQAFMRRVQNEPLALSKADVFKCRVREEQRVKGSKLKTDYAVEEVVEYTQGPRQLKLL